MADFKATAISGSLTRVVSGDTYLIGGANIDITTGSDGRVTIVGTGGGGSSEWTRAAGDIYPTTNPTTTDVLVGNTAIATANTVLLAGGGAIFNEQGAQADFRIESDTKTHAFFIDGSTDQVLILSGGAATSPNEALGTDVAVFVSGAIGSLGSSTKGSSLFGGDALFSGSIRVLNSGKNGGTISGSIHHTEDGLSYLVGSGLVTVSSASNGQITISATGDGSSEWTRNGNNIYPNSPTTTSVYVGDTDSGNPDIIMASNGAATFNEQGGQVDFRVETDGKENALLVKGASNQILILSGGAAASTDSASGTDVAFFVSGTIGSRGTPVRGASVFGGDVIHSGSVAILDPGGTDENLRLVRGPSGNNYIVFEDADGTDRGQIYSNGVHLFLRANTNDLIFRAGTKNVLRMQGSTERVGIGNDLSSPSHMLHVSGTQSEAFRVDTGARENTILSQGDQVLILSGGSGASRNESSTNDVGFFVSGSKGSKHKNGRGTSLFGGDVTVSGSLTVENDGFSGGTISGSIHHTDAGISYLVAGNNITIVSGTNGQVTIESSAGGGTPGGANTQLQYNNGGAFGGISTVTTDGSVVTFGNSAILVGQDITHDGDSDTKIAFADDAIGLTVGGVQLVEVSEAVQDIVKIGNGGDVDFQVRTLNDDNTIYVRGDNDSVGIGTNSPSEKLHVAGDVLTTGTRVILLSGSAMAPSSMQPKESVDINFFVSGAMGSKGTSTRGTAVFGGDLLVSGALHVRGDESYQGSGTGAAIILDANGASRIVWDSEADAATPDAQIYESGGDLYLSASDDISVYPGDVFQVVESSDAGGFFASFFAQPTDGLFRNVLDIGDVGVVINDDSQSSYDFRVESNFNVGMFVVDAGLNVALLNSKVTTSTSESPGLGTDVAVFMSGTRDGSNTTGGGVVLASGDLFVSGAIYEGDQTLLCLRTNDDADQSSAGVANTEYAVFDEDMYSSASPFTDVITAKNCSLNTGTGVLSVTSNNHNKRSMELSFMIRLTSTSAGEAVVKVRDNGLAGTILWQSGIFIGANTEVPLSVNLILPVGSKPTVTVQGAGGQVLKSSNGSTLTYKNI